MNMLLFGPKGYIGTYFQAEFDGIIPCTADISDPAAIAAALEEHQPDVVINAAGKTGRPNVDWCEEHKLETLRSNVTGALHLIEACLERDLYLVHIGSGCIYSGDNDGAGYSEDDPPNFAGSYYARSKRLIDEILQDFPVLNLRLRMPFDGTDNPRNLLMKLRRYPKVLDAPNSITYMPNFFKATRVLMEKRATGTYNVVNPGVASPAEIVAKYKEIVDPSHEFEVITEADLPTTAGRSNCLLSTKKLEAEGIELMDFAQAIEEALETMKSVVFPSS